MYYTVTVYLGGDILTRERVEGMDAVWEIEDKYRELPEYEVHFTPDVRGYIKDKHPTIKLPA